MTFFQIADEYERDFEELELEDMESCAFASLLYVQLGHLSAKRMTDGRITPAMLKKRCAAWAPSALAEAIDSLVRLRKVERTADGGLQFLDWDLTQYTAEQEASRRAKAAERQRRCRARKAAEAAVSHIPQPQPTNETIDESDLVTRDVTPPSASSLNNPAIQEPPTGVRSAGGAAPPPTRGPKKTRPRDAHKETFKRVLGEACRERGVLLEGALSPSQLGAATKRAQEYAEQAGIEFESAALKLSREAVDAVKHGRSRALCWALKDWQPGARQAPPGRRGPLPCGSHEEFSVPGLFEAQMARMRELQRQHAEREAARKAAGYV